MPNTMDMADVFTAGYNAGVAIAATVDSLPPQGTPKTWPSAAGATIETMQDLRRWYDTQVDWAETDASMAIDITGCPTLDAIDELSQNPDLDFQPWPTYSRGMEHAYQQHWEVLLATGGTA